MPSTFHPTRHHAAAIERSILDAAPHAPGSQPAPERRDAAITADSAVRRANMPDGDAPVGGGSTPPNRSNGDGVAYPPIGWNGTIPDGQQVCGSSDDDQMRICCRGTYGAWGRHAMCLVDSGDATAKSLYDCIASKTTIVRAGGVGVACNTGGNSSTVFVNSKGVVRPDRKKDDLYYNKSGAGRVTLGAGIALVALGVLAAF